MKRSVLAALAASLLLHGALVASVLLAAPRHEALPALLIDLTEDSSVRVPNAPSRSVQSVPAQASARAPAPTRRKESSTAARTDRVDAASPVRESPAVDRPNPAESPAVDRPTSVEPPAVGRPTPVEPAAPPSTAAAADPIHEPLESSAGAVSEPLVTAPVTTPEPPLSGSEPSGSAGRTGDSAHSPVSARPPRGSRGPSGEGMATTTDVPADASALHELDSGARAGQDLALAVPGSEPTEPGAVYAGYLGRLRQRIHEAVRYPAAARRRSLTGTVTLEVTILPNGAIGPVRVVESSTHALLDEAAVDSVRSLRPDPFPRDVPARTLKVRLPVVFELR